MNPILIFIGDLLYLVISLLILPLLTFAHCLLGLMQASRYLYRHRKIYVRTLHRYREGMYHVQLRRHWVSFKRG